MKKIKLLKTHTHAGVVHSRGDILDMLDADAQFVITRGIGQALNKTDTQRLQATLGSQSKEITQIPAANGSEVPQLEGES